MTGFERYPPVLDTPGVADMLGLSIEEVRRLAGEGWLPSIMVGAKRLYRRDEILDWLRDQRIPAEEGNGDGDPAPG